MTPADFITSVGGTLVASFELDAYGRNVGALKTHRAAGHCVACGRRGHTVARCTGEHSAPRATYHERRQEGLAAARQEIGRRIKARGRQP